MSTFKLVAKGEVLAGREADEVRANIARLFKLEPDSKQLAAIFSGRPLRLRGGLSREQAEKFQAAIHKAGLGCEIEAEASEMALEPAQAPQPPVTPASSRPVEKVQASKPVPPPQSHRVERDYNPYQQPQAELNVASEPGEFDLVEPKKLSAGAGWGWFKEGFYYFKQSPWLWIATVLLFWLITMVLSMIPFVSIVVNLFMPVLMAGFMVMAYKQFRREDFTIADFFAGFKSNTGSLVAIGGLYLLGMIICVVIGMAVMFMVMGGLDGIAAMRQGGMPPDPLLMLLVFLIVFALLIPLMMAYWFAPALVMLNDMGPVEAMRLSLKGCLRNWLPFLVYGLITLGLGIVAMLPLFLGILVFAPVLMASIFASYRQIYTNTEL